MEETKKAKEFFTAAEVAALVRMQAEDRDTVWKAAVANHVSDETFDEIAITLEKLFSGKMKITEPKKD